MRSADVGRARRHRGRCGTLLPASPRVIGGLVLGLLSLGCITEPDLKTRRDARPVDAGDGWVVSTPAAEGIDSASLADALDLFYAGDAYYNVISLLVVRHGKLVAEAFAHDPAERLARRNVQSITKSFTSLVFGIARDEGYFPDLDRTLYDIMPDKFDDDLAKRGITLRHLLTMRSGIAFDNDDFALEMLIRKPADQVRYILRKPLYALPGDSFYYRDADPQLLSSAVQRVTGRTLDEIALERLFAPLGIVDARWEVNVEGTPLGAFGLYLRGRDLAKLGELFLRRGVWPDCGDGQECRIVSESWVDLSTSFQTASDDPALPYGYYWWIVPELSSFMASGHGGNFVLVVPAKDLVLVLTALPDAGDDAGTSADQFLAIARTIVEGTD